MPDPSDSIYAAGSSFTLIHYDGKAWSVIDTPSSWESFVDIQGASESEIYLLGGWGSVYRYDTVEFTPLRYEDGGDFQRMSLGPAPEEIAVVEFYGSVFRYDGSAWQEETLNKSAGMWDILRIGQTQYAIGNGVLRKYLKN